MCRSPRDGHRFQLILVPLLLGCWPVAATAQDSATDRRASDEVTPALLDVRVNGWATGVVARFRLQGGRLAIRAEQFDAIGFRENGDLVTSIAGVRWVELDRLTGVHWTIDPHAQAIDITAPPALLKETDFKVSSSVERVQSRADWGAMLSYDLYGQWSPQSRNSLFGRTFSADLDARIFSPHFTVASTGLVTVSDTQSRYVRLDTSIVFDDPDSSQSLRIGDSYTAGPNWVRTIRFGGLQWARNFSLRPDIVISPVASLSRDIAVPSTIDLFVNGVRSYSQAVNPGVVRLDDLPVPSGSNTIDMVVTDQAGRRTQVSLLFYSSSQLLAAGMTDFDLEAGFPRLSYTQASNAYGRPFASGTISRGITDRLTLRGYAAATHGYEGAAFGATLRVGSLGVIDSALMVSSGSAGTGAAYHFGVEHIAHRFSLSASYTHADSDYRDLASTFDASVFVDQATAALGLNLGRAGSVNVAYVLSKSATQSLSSIASGSYRLHVGRQSGIDLSASAFAETRGGGWGGILSATLQLGRRSRAYAQQSWRDGQQTISAQVNGESRDQRLNWQVQGSRGATDELSAQANWRGTSAGLYGRIDHLNGSTGVQAELSQSLIFMGGQFFVSRLVDDGFALVDVSGQKGVRVSLENHLIGVTKKDGRLLVPGLQPYVANRLSINALDLPANAIVKDTRQLVAPRRGGGTMTRFDVRVPQSALVTIRKPDGTSIPVGASVTRGQGSEANLLGYDGQVYVRDVAPGINRLIVTWPGQECSASFSLTPAQHHGLPRIGPLTCDP
ncbi:fimbria/pilus outer membrane usher protein [soil metagenome]